MNLTNKMFNLFKIIFKIDINTIAALVGTRKVRKMGKKDILKKLDKRLAEGEISEELYNEIVSRYEGEGEGKAQEEEEMDMDMEMDMEIEDDTGVKSEDRHEEKEETVVNKEEPKKEKTKRVSLSGASKVEGCNCEIFRAAGASKVDGDLRADDADVSGATKIDGDLYVNRLDSSGSLKVNGKTEGDELDLSGASKFKKNVAVDNIDFSGSFKVDGSVKCDTIDGSGSTDITDTLRGEEIRLYVSGKSKIRDIKGGDIAIESGGSRFLFGLKKSGSLDAESITGDEIYLENTKAKKVSGDKVRIGPGCKIENVKAKELKIHESAKVENKKGLVNLEKK